MTGTDGLAGAASILATVSDSSVLPLPLPHPGDHPASRPLLGLPPPESPPHPIHAAPASGLVASTVATPSVVSAQSQHPWGTAVVTGAQGAWSASSREQEDVASSLRPTKAPSLGLPASGYRVGAEQPRQAPRNSWPERGLVGAPPHLLPSVPVPLPPGAQPCKGAPRPGSPRCMDSVTGTSFLRGSGCGISSWKSQEYFGFYPFN